MAHVENTEENSFQSLHLSLYLVGGLCAGTGIVNLLWSFGSPAGDMNQTLNVVGFSALDNLQPMTTFSFAIPLIVVGAICLVAANAMAWRETGGY